MSRLDGLGIKAEIMVSVVQATPVKKLRDGRWLALGTVAGLGATQGPHEEDRARAGTGVERAGDEEGGQGAWYDPDHARKPVFADGF